MKHIVIDARIISTTTGRYIERLLHHLEKIDHIHKYTVLVKTKDLEYWKPTNKNFTLKVADYKNYSLNEQVGFLRLIKSLKPDLVHFCTPEQPVLYKRKKVTTIHDLTLLNTYNPDKNWLVYHFKQLVGQFVFRHVARTSSSVITSTDYSRDTIIKTLGVEPSRIKTTHLSAEAVLSGQKRVDLPSENFIFFVGQQSAYKNIVRLAEAHQTLLLTYPDLELVLVGKIDSAAERNQHLFKKRNYKNITFTGFVDDQQLNWLFKHTKAYVFPSLMEGFGLPGLEAMLQGAPVVSSNATCLPEVYGDAALYFDPESIDSIAQSIYKVIADTDLRKKLIAKGDIQIKKYSWRRTAEQTFEIYNSALDS